MANEGTSIDVSEITEEIRSGLPSSPGVLSEREFARFCENIARAIVKAVESYERRDHAQEPDFGEITRAEEGAAADDPDTPLTPGEAEQPG